MGERKVAGMDSADGRMAGGKQGWWLAGMGTFARMNLYQTIIEQISLENQQLLFLLGIPTLASAPHLSEDESRRRGPSHIAQLSERNRVLRHQIASAFPTLNLDTHLRRDPVH